MICSNSEISKIMGMKGSIWREKGREASFPNLQDKTYADVAIIGAGITGLTSALLLAEAGLKVVIIEANQVGAGTTGYSSCHLTTDIDEEYRNVISSFGEDIANIVAQSRRSAINFIERIAQDKYIDCDFKRLPGYFYTESQEDVNTLLEESEAAIKAGLNVKLVDSLPLPFKIKKALKFEDQAEFNSQKYLDGLANYVNSLGAIIYENTLLTNMEEVNDIYHLHTSNGGIVKANQVIMATHYPLFFNVLQTMAAPYISYMIAAKLKSNEYPVGLFWDTDEPYHYTRYYVKDGSAYVVVGGEDHKTGTDSDTDYRFVKLEKYIRDRFDIESIDYKWSAQYYEPADGLPYIGKSPFSKNVFVGTGYSGDGLVYGTIAGQIISNIILELDNPWLKAYDSLRFTPGASAADFIKENVGVVKHFFKDRIPDTDNLDDIAPGEGKIVKFNGEKLAVSRDKNNELHAVSPACTHMKCFVDWNNTEQTWDCPCHGSRFTNEGEVLYGPAVTALAKKDINAEVEKLNNKK
jgi:glycine/D-amino acid oxidase-like deaminating enzyme/nitrite reductase/ring-hydroxylating ferredoxin subunit